MNNFTMFDNIRYYSTFCDVGFVSDFQDFNYKYYIVINWGDGWSMFNGRWSKAF